VSARACANSFRRDLPEAVRSARWHIMIAALALLAGLAAGFMLDCA